MAVKAVNTDFATFHEPFQLATLQNSWANINGVYSSMSFSRDSLGRVTLMGIGKSGTIGLPMFTLPVGYRPVKNLYLPTATNGAAGICEIWPDGRVVPQIGSNGSFSLDGITFLNY